MLGDCQCSAYQPLGACDTERLDVKLHEHALIERWVRKGQPRIYRRRLELRCTALTGNCEKVRMPARKGNSMSAASVMDAINQRAYDGHVAIHPFRRTEGLFPAERVVLEKIADELRDRRLLDLGVGGGRTTTALLRISQDYTGIDYSARLVDFVKRRTGVRTIYQADARDMRGLFKDENFDFVLFSFNGIDYVSHNGRLAALSEINRVLKPGGWFFFSSHNRAAANTAKRHEGPRDLIKRLLFLRRRLRLRRLESHTPEYAILNDSGLHYSLLTYYVDLATQVAQLASAGFEFIEAYNIEGRPVVEDHTSPFIHYLAKKAR
jgi:SAM-dependent methyltransferase